MREGGGDGSVGVVPVSGLLGITVFGLYSANVFENHNCGIVLEWGSGMDFFFLY